MTSNTSDTFYCANHPQRETRLRCNRCEKPICPECAVLTPTGYRCRDCVRSQQKTFDTSKAWDYPLAFMAAGVLAFVGSLIASMIGYFILLLAPVIGIAAAESVRFVVRKRRSKGLLILATVAAVLGSLPLLLIDFLGGNWFAILIQVIYTFMMTSTLYYRLGGIRIR
jgi:hypothetical protein